MPLLRKDFITRRAQIEQSRDMGADAVLLTAGLLPPDGLNRLVGDCLELGLTPFVEVTTEQEIDRLLHPEACVLAVNNRDIRTKERTGQGIERSRALASAVLVVGAGCPASASGIDSPEVARELLTMGYRALLVGTALLDADDHSGWSELAAPTEVAA